MKPQEAVGAIWRCRRVLAVGDPRQLQPVVTMPRDAEDTIARAFGVSHPWVPSRSSVQALADRMGLWGTTIRATDTPGDAEDDPQAQVWVSAPLRVHRRCDEPMFSICNHIAYGDIMIKGHHCDCDQLPASTWIDVPNPQRGEKVQDKEINALADHIDKLLSHPRMSASNIFVVSPFRPVVARIKSEIFEKHPE